MGTFKIEVQEFLARVIEIDAKNVQDAFAKVQKQYKNEKIVLDYNDFVDVNFIDINGQSKEDEKNMLIKEIIEYIYVDEQKHFEESNNPENHIGLPFKSLEDGFIESGVEANKIFKGLGLTAYYRYGPNQLPRFDDNISIKVSYHLDLGF